MNDKSKTLLPTDNVFVTLTQNGKNILNLYRNNFSSISDIVKFVYMFAKGSFGITILNIRNQSQGWCCNVPLMFSYQKDGVMKKVCEKENTTPRQCELPFAW